MSHSISAATTPWLTVSWGGSWASLPRAPCPGPCGASSLRMAPLSSALCELQNPPQPSGPGHSVNDGLRPLLGHFQRKRLVTLKQDAGKACSSPMSSTAKPGLRMNFKKKHTTTLPSLLPGTWPAYPSPWFLGEGGVFPF